MKRLLLTLIVLQLSVATLFAQSEAVTPAGSLNITKEVKPPIFELVETVAFIDPSGNNVIDANETCKIVMKVKNIGLGDGFGLKGKISATGATAGISFNTQNVPVIKVGETKTVEFPITSNLNTIDGTVEIVVQIEEPNGFGTDKQYVSVNTRKFVSPMVEVVDYSITGDRGGVLQKVSTFDLQILVQNTQYGNAEDVTVRIQIPKNIHRVGGEEEVTTFSSLKSGEQKSLVYKLIADQNFAGETIPIKFLLSEKFGKYAKNEDIALQLNQKLSDDKIVVTPNDPVHPDDIVIASLSSDVDKNIPQTNVSNNSTHVMIIANQDYTKESQVSTALNDARIMEQYCIKTLGIPSNNIKLHENQSYINMKTEIDNFAKTISYNKGSKFMFFYFGHGMTDPDPKIEDSYMLPVDGSSVYLKSEGLSRNAMVKKFADNNPAQLLIYMESCFSGATNTDKMLAYGTNSSGMKFVEKISSFAGNIVMFSASSKAETANAFPKQNHNVFTYEFLKELQRTKGDSTLGEIFEAVKTNTAKTAHNELKKDQHPNCKTSTTLGDGWKGWRLK